MTILSAQSNTMFGATCLLTKNITDKIQFNQKKMNITAGMTMLSSLIDEYTHMI
eukprot:UN04667